MDVTIETVTAAFARIALVQAADGVPQTTIALGLVRTVEALMAPAARPVISKFARQAIADELRRVADQISARRA